MNWSDKRACAYCTLMSLAMLGVAFICFYPGAHVDPPMLVFRLPPTKQYTYAYPIDCGTDTALANETASRLSYPLNRRVFKDGCNTPTGDNRDIGAWWPRFMLGTGLVVYMVGFLGFMMAGAHYSDTTTKEKRSCVVVVFWWLVVMAPILFVMVPVVMYGYVSEATDVELCVPNGIVSSDHVQALTRGAWYTAKTPAEYKWVTEQVMAKCKDMVLTIDPPVANLYRPLASSDDVQAATRRIKSWIWISGWTTIGLALLSLALTVFELLCCH